MSPADTEGSPVSSYSVTGGYISNWIWAQGVVFDAVSITQSWLMGVSEWAVFYVPAYTV